MMPKKLPDTRKHLASRRAVKRVLDLQKVVTVSKRFDHGHVTTRVLVGGEYYEVDNRQLDLLEMGRSPAQLGIEPAAHH
jgi:hypothetical protein